MLAPKTEITPLGFPRPTEGFSYTGPLPSALRSGGLVGWQSNGGPSRGHPAKSHPFTLEVELSDVPGPIRVLHLIGVFALFAGRAEEAWGTLGASIHLVGARDPEFRKDLLNGRHYSDASQIAALDESSGEGMSIKTVGEIVAYGARQRVDLLSIDIPGHVEADRLRFKDLGSPASFLIFDIYAECDSMPSCPFHGHAGRVALSEIGSIIRVGDRRRFLKALYQLDRALLAADDLDEARGQALTFLAMVTAATLEMGGSRAMHRVQLDAARELDRLNSCEEIATRTRVRVEEVCGVRFQPSTAPSGYLVDQALAIVDRNFARNLTDTTVATQLGLSTSHFRFLFREATGQPFHKYLIALRLERAKQLLVQQDLAVSDVARAVGFGGLSHFSRAFTQRFAVSPSHLRRGID